MSFEIYEQSHNTMKKDGKPFFCFNMKTFEETFCADFYAPLTPIENYAKKFVEDLTKIKQVGLTPDAQPFFFTQCNRCSNWILTNYQPNTKINCKVCEKKFKIKVAQKSELDAILELISQEMEMDKEDNVNKSVVIIIMFQSPSIKEALIICKQKGFIRIPQCHPVANSLYKQIVAEDQYNTKLPYFFCRKLCSQGEGNLPPESQQLIREIKSSIPNSKSFCITVDKEEEKKVFPEISKMLAEKEKTREAIWKGNKRFANDDIPGALKSYQEAAKHDKNSLMALYHISDIYLHMKEYKESMNWAKKAIAVAPHYANAHSALGKALFGLKQYKQALEELRKGGESPIIMLQTGVCYAKLKSWEKAEKVFRKALQDDPAYKTRHCMDIMYEDNPISARMHHSLARVLQMQNKIEQAKLHYSLAKKINPKIVLSKMYKKIMNEEELLKFFNNS